MLPVEIVDDVSSADLVVTTKNFYRRRTQALRQAEERGRPVYVLRKNTTAQIQQFLKAIARSQKQMRSEPGIEDAVREAEEAIKRIGEGDHEMTLGPQGAYVRHLQHQLAESQGMTSTSSGREPARHVTIYRR